MLVIRMVVGMADNRSLAKWSWTLTTGVDLSREENACINDDSNGSKLRALARIAHAKWDNRRSSDRIVFKLKRQTRRNHSIEECTSMYQLQKLVKAREESSSCCANILSSHIDEWPPSHNTENLFPAWSISTHEDCLLEFLRQCLRRRSPFPFSELSFYGRF